MSVLFSAIAANGLIVGLFTEPVPFIVDLGCSKGGAANLVMGLN